MQFPLVLKVSFFPQLYKVISTFIQSFWLLSLPLKLKSIFSPNGKGGVIGISDDVPSEIVFTCYRDTTEFTIDHMEGIDLVFPLCVISNAGGIGSDSNGVDCDITLPVVATKKKRIVVCKSAGEDEEVVEEISEYNCCVLFELL